MGIVINPRGTGGSGKTALVRRIMQDYGPAVPIRRAGRQRPIGYRLRHPAAGRPLAVLGAYEGCRGGCDTIPLGDGGLEEAFRLAAAWAAEGQDVVLEGLLLSAEVQRTAALAELHPVHVLRLATPLGDCTRALVARRRAGLEARPGIGQGAAMMDLAVEEACRRLDRTAARVERLEAGAALRRARALLGLVDSPLLAVPA